MIGTEQSQWNVRARPSPIRFAVVGVGYWGPNLVRNLFDLEGAEISHVCDVRPEALESITRRYPGLTTTDSLNDLLADKTVDAVAIATPVTSHFPLARAALEAGKHVIVEKPLAASSAEARQLIELASCNGLVLMPGHTFLYSPSVNLIHAMINEGAIGDLYFISTSRVNLGLHQPDVSVIWDLAPHDFSILRYWLEETPSHVSALSRECVLPGIPDVAFVDLEFSSGVIAHVELSWLAPSKLRRTTIVGSEKMIVYDDTSLEPIRLFDSGVLIEDPKTFGEYKLSYRTGDIISPHVGSVEPLSLELADFCSAIRDGSTPRSDWALGLDVVRMIEATERSVREGRRVAANDLWDELARPLGAAD